MFNIIYPIFLSLIFFGSLHIDFIKLHIDSSGDNISVKLENHGGSTIIVDKRFAINPLLGELKFNIKDGRKGYQIAVIANVGPPTKGDFITLNPGDFVGHKIPINIIFGIYNLKAGCYSMQAIYEYKLGGNNHAFSDKLSSNTIKVCSSNKDRTK